MGRHKSTTLTAVELEFMQIIWAAEEAVTTTDVQAALAEQGRKLTDGSIRKVLSILVRKGYITRRRLGRGFVYRRKVGEGKANRHMVSDLLKRAFGGSAALMVAALMETRAVRKKDLEEIKRLIAKREDEQ